MAEARQVPEAVVRPATLEDVEAIRGIYNHAVLNTVATLDDAPRGPGETAAWFEIHRDTHPVFAADLDGAIAGYGALSLFARRGGYRVSAEISVYVAPERQRVGVGTALCRALTAHAEESGLVSVTALISRPNIGARRLFEATGYEHQGALRRIGAKFGRIVDLEIYQWFGVGKRVSSKPPQTSRSSTHDECRFR